MRLLIMTAQRYKRSSCKRWVNRERTPHTLAFIILGVGWLRHASPILQKNRLGFSYSSLGALLKAGTAC